DRGSTAGHEDLTAALEGVTDADRRWFEANPAARYRLRKVRPIEVTTALVVMDDMPTTRAVVHGQVAAPASRPSRRAAWSLPILEASPPLTRRPCHHRRAAHPHRNSESRKCGVSERWRRHDLDAAVLLRALRQPGEVNEA